MTSETTPPYRSVEPKNESTRLTDNVAATMFTTTTAAGRRAIQPAGSAGDRRSPATKSPPPTTTVIQSTASFGNPNTSDWRGSKAIAVNSGPTTTTMRAASWNV